MKLHVDPQIEAAGEAAMKLLCSLDFAMPLNFESDHPDYPIYIGGTCFLTRLHGRFLVFTAQHCLRGSSREGTAVIVGPDKAHLPLYREVHLAEYLKMPWADVSCITTHPTDYLTSLPASRFVDLDAMGERDLWANLSTQLFVLGFPNARDDYSPKKVSRGIDVWAGLYAGPTPDAHLHRLDLSYALYDSSKGSNGLSGSPVLTIRKHPNGVVEYDLVGIVVQGQRNCDCTHLYFIDVSILLRFAHAVVTEAAW